MELHKKLNGKLNKGCTGIEDLSKKLIKGGSIRSRTKERDKGSRQELLIDILINILIKILTGILIKILMSIHAKIRIKILINYSY